MLNFLDRLAAIQPYWPPCTAHNASAKRSLNTKARRLLLFSSESGIYSHLVPDTSKEANTHHPHGRWLIVIAIWFLILPIQRPVYCLTTLQPLALAIGSLLSVPRRAATEFDNRSPQGRRGGIDIQKFGTGTKCGVSEIGEIGSKL